VVPSFSSEESSASSIFAFVPNKQKKQKKLLYRNFNNMQNIFRRARQHKKQKEEKKRDKGQSSLYYSLFLSLFSERRVHTYKQQHKHARFAREVKRER